MKRYILFALVATMFAGCVKDTTEDMDLKVGVEKVYATIAPTESRVQLNAQKQTVWTAGDEIIILYETKCRVASFDGKTGDRSGSFTVNKNYTYSNTLTDIPYAVYASDATDRQLMRWSDDQIGPMVRIPSYQLYLKDSYASNVNVMVGTSNDGGTNFAFKNVLGYLRLGLTGDKQVRFITLESNGGEAISGQIVLRLDNPDAFSRYNEASSSMTLDCSQGVQLSDTPTYFYFAIAPLELSQGFKVLVEFMDGSLFEQSTSNTITIERNYICPMATIKTNLTDDDFQKVYIHHTAKSFVAPLVEATNGTIDWGDGTTSMLNEFTSYDYLDNASSHIITIKAVNPSSITVPSMKGVTKLDFSNF